MALVPFGTKRTMQGKDRRNIKSGRMPNRMDGGHDEKRERQTNVGGPIKSLDAGPAQGPANVEEIYAKHPRIPRRNTSPRAR